MKVIFPYVSIRYLLPLFLLQTQPPMLEILWYIFFLVVRKIVLLRQILPSSNNHLRIGNFQLAFQKLVAMTKSTIYSLVPYHSYRSQTIKINKALFPLPDDFIVPHPYLRSFVPPIKWNECQSSSNSINADSKFWPKQESIFKTS